MDTYTIRTWWTDGLLGQVEATSGTEALAEWMRQNPGYDVNMIQANIED